MRGARNSPDEHASIDSAVLPSEVALSDIARDRVVDAESLARHGLGPRQVAQWVRHSRLMKLSHGQYAVEPAKDRDDLHLLRTVAALRTRGPASATGISGLIVRAIPTLVAPAVVYLATDREWAVRLTPAVVVRQARAPGELFERPPVLVDALRCQPVTECVVDAGREFGSESALIAADYCLHHGLATLGELEAAARAGLPGIAAVRAAFALADGVRESPGESRAAWALHLLGYATEAQFSVGRYRADLRIVGTRVLVEFDGAVKYPSREALIAEKRREDEIRSQGYTVVRLMWTDLASLDRVRFLVQRGLRADLAA